MYLCGRIILIHILLIMFLRPKNDVELSRRQLEVILGRRRLRFNPYKVSDKQLIEYAWQGAWGDAFDLTQMVIMTFTRRQTVDDYRKVLGIYARIGRSENEILISRSRLINRVTAHDTLQGVRSLYGKRPICNEKDLEHLVGKTVFVSRVIQGKQNYRIEMSAVAYRMHRLWGNTARDARIIRTAMCEAKIEMLERLLANPESPNHLNCSKGLFDYTSPILSTIEMIRRYPLTPIPPDPA